MPYAAGINPDSYPWQAMGLNSANWGHASTHDIVQQPLQKIMTAKGVLVYPQQA